MANRQSGNDSHHLLHTKKILEKIVDYSHTSNLHENIFQDISNAFGLALVNVKKGEGEIGSGIFIGRLKANGKNQWTGPIFLTLYEGEIGFNAGISNSDYFLIFNEEESLQKLKENGEFKLSDTETEKNSKFKKGVIIHTVSSKGSFIGASLEGNIIKIDNKKTKKYYKKKFSIEDIISGKIDLPNNVDYQNIIDLLNKLISNIKLPQNFEPQKLSFQNEFFDDAHNELLSKNGSFSSQLSNNPTRDSATYESQENEDGDFKMQESQEPKQGVKFANEAISSNLALKKDQDAITEHPSNELPLPEQTISNNVLADENFKNKISDNPLVESSLPVDKPLGNQQSPRHTNNEKEIEQSEGLGITDAVMETFFNIVGEANDENKAVEKYPLETAEKESITANSSSTNKPEESDHETLPTLDATTNETQNPPYQSLPGSEPKNKLLQNTEEKALLTNQSKKSKKIGNKSKRFLLCFACLCPGSKNSTELGVQKSIHEFNKIDNFNEK